MLVRKIATATNAIAVVAYPVAAYVAFTRLPPRLAAAILFAVVAVAVLAHRIARPRADPDDASPAPTRAASVKAIATTLGVAFAVTLGLLATSAALRWTELALMVPVAVNAALLVAFGSTLLRPPPMIERFARLVEDDLTPAELRWCRGWTWGWCAFFATNGAIAGWLALAGPLAAWTTYNGLLSYVAMGCMFGVEYTVRKYRFGKLGEHALDRALRRLFAALDRRDRSR